MIVNNLNKFKEKRRATRAENVVTVKQKCKNKCVRNRKLIDDVVLYI